MKRDPTVYLHHIVDECAFIIAKSKGLSKEKFLVDDLLKHAFVKAIEIIGEAVKNVPDKIRENYFHIDWNNIAGMRDRTVHAYFDINYQIVGMSL